MYQLRRNKNLLAASFVLIVTVLGGNAYADKKQFPKIHLTPFTNVATINAVTGPGGINHEDSDALAKEVAIAIATYVATNDDIDLGFDTDWVLGGLEGLATEDAIKEAILHVPTPFAIDPDEPVDSNNRKKVHLIEMCNPTFAKKAMGILPVIDDDDPTNDDASKIVNGRIHAPALPCETAVYFDGTKIQIDMLNPVAIFTLFFTDVLFGEQMQDPAFAEAIQVLPVQVNEEIVTIIYAALEGAEYTFTEKHKALGPKYQWLDEVVEEVANTRYLSPFVHFTYLFTPSYPGETLDVKAIAESIIVAASTTGDHAPELDAQLNEDDWRSARPGPLPIPGNQVIEMCSPTNAIKAMSTGLHHATALPCEVALTAIEDKDEDVTKLLVSYLNPHFMFNALFKDAFNQMSDEELEEFAALPPLVLKDLQAIVAWGLQNHTELGAPEQVCYGMLPSGYPEDCTTLP